MNKSEAIALRKQIAAILGVDHDQEFKADTTAGIMRCHHYGMERRYKSRQWSPGWLYLQFDDPHAAVIATRGSCSHHSGKWNLHYGNQTDVDELRRRIQLIEYKAHEG